MNEWGADPEKYAKLAEPFESAEAAQKATEAFLEKVRLLREEYHIPELIVSFEVYLKKDGEVYVLPGGAGWGDQTRQAQIAKRAADREMGALLGMLDHLFQVMPGVRSYLLTDPKPPQPDDKENK